MSSTRLGGGRFVIGVLIAVVLATLGFAYLFPGCASNPPVRVPVTGVLLRADGSPMASHPPVAEKAIPLTPV